MTTLEAFPDDWQRALAIVAHPDDLEYGTASAVARWAGEGRWVGYTLVTRGEAGIDGMEPEEAARVRSDEERAAAGAVGVDTVEFLDHRDGIVEYGLDLRRDLARVIRRHRPDGVLTTNYGLTWGGHQLNMADHRNVGLAVLDASRDAGNRWIFPELVEEGLDPWGGVRWVAANASPEPTHVVDVTGHLAAGVASLECHRTYLAAVGGNPREFLERAARRAGEAFGCEHAVTFEVMHV